MFRLQGDWFDGKTSARQKVLFEVDAQGNANVHCAHSQQLLMQTEFSLVDVTSQIGETPRYLYFPHGQKLETLEHSQVNALLKNFRPSLFSSLAHKLETHLKYVLFTVVAVIAIGWWTVNHGLPLSARIIAEALPQSIMNRASVESMTLLDKMYFSPSQLDDATRAELTEAFSAALRNHADVNIRIEFREGGTLGANALALPDGTIIFTDEIIQLSQNNNELLAVLAHEIGHVEHRHGLRSAIQSTFMSFAITMLVGDATALGDLLVTLPLVLTTSAFSRDFEREADNYSLQFLDKYQIPRHSFTDLMERITYDAKCTILLYEQGKSLIDKNAADESLTHRGNENIAAEKMTRGISKARQKSCDKLLAEEPQDSINIFDYFTTHPSTEERVKIFKQSKSE